MGRKLLLLLLTAQVMIAAVLRFDGTCYAAAMQRGAQRVWKVERRQSLGHSQHEPPTKAVRLRAIRTAGAWRLSHNDVKLHLNSLTAVTGGLNCSTASGVCSTDSRTGLTTISLHSLCVLWQV